jgi:hypothetical protein
LEPGYEVIVVRQQGEQKVAACKFNLMEAKGCAIRTLGEWIKTFKASR